MKKKKRSKIINLIQSALVFVFCSLALITVVFTWFTMFVENTVSGISLTAQSPEIYISDTIAVRRGFDDKEEEKVEITFKRDADGVYYEYFKEEGEEEGAWVLDSEGNKKPLSIKGLWPGESVDFYVPVNKENAADNLLANLRLGDISGDLFSYIDEEGEEIIYSILSVYRVNAFDAENNMISSVWLDSYNEGNVISNRSWGDGEEQIILHFSVTFDLSQIDNPERIIDLEEKRFSIGRIVITASQP